MPKTDTTHDHTRRLLRVVHHLWQHLDEPLTLEHMAAVAHFSPYHFHRIYRMTMGETLNATLQRLRLLRASHELMQPAAHALTRIASRAGYRSSAAFVRAFGAAYGMPPGQYRQQRSAYLRSLFNKELSMYTPQFRTIDQAIHLIALPHRGSYLTIDVAFTQLALQTQALGIAPDARWFGIYLDDPESVAEADLRSFAGVEASVETSLPSGAERLSIAAGRYAVIEHIGPYSELEQAYKWLFGVWLPASGEQAADQPMAELYLNSPQDTAPKDLRTEVWLPLR